jgi:cytochrome b6-f complex iron-sulfur subunit
MTPKKISRRDFITTTLMGSGLFAGLIFWSVYAIQFLFPSMRTPPTRKVFVAMKDKILTGDSYKFNDLKGNKITIVNTGKEYIALSTKCTHLGCQVLWKNSESVFYCPCHDGYFDAQGKVMKGPPPKPLNTYKVEVVDQAIYIHVDEVYSERV